MKIELENGKWLVNGKPFTELNANERILLNEFFKLLKNEL